MLVASAGALNEEDDPVNSSPGLQLRAPRRPRRRRLATAVLLAAGAAIALAGCGPELGPIFKLRQLPGAQLPETSDPSTVVYGDHFYLYGSDNHLRAPVTRLSDIGRAYSLSEKNALTSEAMPTQPAWSARARQTWAPTVAAVGGRWLMMFSADRRDPPQPWNPQCIGRAWADHPLGPFVPEANPANCGINGIGGALDPQFFRDPLTGQNWLLAAYGDTESPLHAMPIDEAGNLVAATPILARQHAWEYHFIENPAMVYDPVRGNYLLAYSAGRWWEPWYSTGIARCSTPAGPCTSDPSGPWIGASYGRTGPGGLSFVTDNVGSVYAVLSTFAEGRESQQGGRAAAFMPLTLEPAVGLGPVVK